LRHFVDERLVVVERCRTGALAFSIDAAEQVADHLAGGAKAGGNGVSLGRFAASGLLGDKGQRNPAVTVDDFKFQRVAALGRERQGQRNLALRDHRPVGAIGQLRLDFGEQTLAGNQIGEEVGELFGGELGLYGCRLILGDQAQLAGDIGGNHGEPIPALTLLWCEGLQ